MMDGILGQIANPQLADVAGALDYRRAQINKDEEKRKELKMNQYAAEAAGFMTDGPMKQMFLTDPKMAMMISKQIGIPMNQGEKLEKFRQNVGVLAGLAKADPRMAIEHANKIKAENDRLGIEDVPLNRWVTGVNSAMENGDQDGVITHFNALGVMNDSFNPQKADVISAEKKEEFRLKEKELDWKMSQPGGGENAPVESIQTWNQYQKLGGDKTEAGIQFGRKHGFISREGEKLSAFAEKAIADSADAANSSRSSAARYTTLADNLRNATKMSGGLKGTWGEWIKEQTGNQDELTALRKEALGITNSEAIASLPPGPATDRDIEMAKAPFPTEKSDPTYVADWLSAVSRLQQKKAEYAEFKADFISKHGSVRSDGKSLSSAWKESQKSAQPASRFKIEVSD